MASVTCDSKKERIWPGWALWPTKNKIPLEQAMLASGGTSPPGQQSDGAPWQKAHHRNERLITQARHADHRPSPIELPQRRPRHAFGGQPHEWRPVPAVRSHALMKLRVGEPRAERL